MSGLVLISGAGPVGMTMAWALRRRGVDVRIVDRAPARTDKSKALVLWPRTLELLDILGDAKRFIAAGLPALGARILVDGKTLVQVDLQTARSAYRYALMIPQSETERLLDDRLQALGMPVERSTSLESFVDDGEGITAVLTRADGSPERVRAEWLIGCDGAHSTVRHGLAAATFEGETLPSEWILADLELSGDLPRDQITICWTHDGVLVFFPISRGSLSRHRRHRAHGQGGRRRTAADAGTGSGPAESSWAARPDRS